MKRLTIDETWEQCLAMWKWISEKCEGMDIGGTVIDQIKVEYMESNGMKEDEVLCDCFFCDECSQACDECQFAIYAGEHCTVENLYSEDPVAFYAELKRLNKIRLERKSK